MKKDAQAEQAVNELEVKKRSQLSYIWFRFRKTSLPWWACSCCW